MELTVTSARQSGAVVLAVAGEFDIATAPTVTAAVQAELEADPAPLVLDLTATTFADSSACRVLVQTAKACRRRGSGLEIVCPTGNTAVRRVLDLVGMAAVAPLREGVAATAAGGRRAGPSPGEVPADAAATGRPGATGNDGGRDPGRAERSA